MTSILYRNLRPEQEDLIAALTERYATQKIRFDTGFVGSIPVINDVTGDEWAGELEPEDAAGLFVQLMDQLRRVPYRKTRDRPFAALRRGSFTPPANWKQGIIRKPSRRRR
ncbi:hypothetical protein [Paenarthrobacter sp. C1]|uniref:hypothetical protein n=1 Tax=Paenarthrobacter sp. C1 TaxID=3400220 RepID=UPI003BF5C0EF